MTTTTLPAVSIRPAGTRGTTNLGWLDSRHAFSFGRYHDPDRTGYHGLRVLNDDRVAPGGGFPLHPHDNMEILSWVLDGHLVHSDSTGSVSTIAPGTAQLMTAGSGVMHSEFNASDTQPVHFLQVWIEPAERGIAPNYQEYHTEAALRRNTFATLATPGGRDGSLTLHADAVVSTADVQPGAAAGARVDLGRVAYAYVAAGTGEVNGVAVEAGDALTADAPGRLRFAAGDAPMQVMLFDLPA